MHGAGNNLIVSRASGGDFVRIGQIEYPISTPRKSYRRLWVMLVVSLVLSALGGVLVWFQFGPSYRVAAVLHVASSAGAAESESAVENQRQHIATEIVSLRSPSVINAALDSPGIRTLHAFEGVVDPADWVLSGLSVRHLTGTELIEVSMMGRHPRDLCAVVSAVIQSYLSRRDKQEQARRDEVIETLATEQSDLQARLIANEARQEQANKNIDSLPESAAANLDTRVAEIRSKQAELDRERAVAIARISGLHAVVDQDGPPVGDPQELKEFLSQDRELEAFRSQLASVDTQILEDEQDGRSFNHPDVRRKIERRAALLDRIAYRERKLREPYIIEMSQKIQLEIDDIDVQAAVLFDELERLTEQRRALSRNNRDLEDLEADHQRIALDLAEIRARIREASVDENKRSYVTLHAPAEVPIRPNVDCRPTYIAGVVIASMFVGTIAGLLSYRPRRQARDLGELSVRLGINVLGMSDTFDRSGAALSEGTQLQLSSAGNRTATALAAMNPRLKCRLITSPISSDGKSGFAIDLAHHWAAQGHEVLLVDADGQARDTTRTMNLLDKKGLADILGACGGTDEVTYAGDVPNLTVLPTGSPHGLQLEQLRDWPTRVGFHAILDKYEAVVIDAPPVLSSAGVVLLAGLAEEVVLLIQPGLTAEEHARHARQFLLAGGCQVTGVLLSS